MGFGGGSEIAAVSVGAAAGRLRIRTDHDRPVEIFPHNRPADVPVTFFKPCNVTGTKLQW
ncbi:hypothetical protein [Nonomuraea wenchangensis]|uniref:hypothetical protein n=1 Tax=Nonomuraea wenchangensis TaxID=568860 RepID=UPI003422DE23